MHVHDLHAADAVYHQTCSVNFCTKKQMPMAKLTITENVKRPKLGWPRDDERTHLQDDSQGGASGILQQTAAAAGKKHY